MIRSAIPFLFDMPIVFMTDSAFVLQVLDESANFTSNPHDIHELLSLSGNRSVHVLLHNMLRDIRGILLTQSLIVQRKQPCSSRIDVRSIGLLTTEEFSLPHIIITLPISTCGLVELFICLTCR